MKELKGIPHKKRGLYLGVGVMDYQGLIWENGENIKSYTTWVNMLRRCYDGNYRGKYATYENCTVCDEWLFYSNFKVWYDNNYIESWHLDKDLLQKGVKNKVYSPQTCCFLPKEINNLLEVKNTEKELPSCVSRTGKNSFRVRVRIGDGKVFRSKIFHSLQDATNCATEIKQSYVLDLSIKLLKENKISDFIFNSIINYFKT